MLDTVTVPARPHRWTLWLARLGWLALFLLVAGMAAANLPYLAADVRFNWQVTEALPAARALFGSAPAFVSYLATLKLLAFGVFAGAGLLLAWRRPSDPMALFTSAALLLSGFLFALNLSVEETRYPRLLEAVLPGAGYLVPALQIVMLVLLVYLFPDGRFYPSWSRWIALSLLAVTFFFFSQAFVFRWHLFPGVGDVAWAGFGLSVLAAIAIGLAAQIARYRRAAGPVQRQQTRLVVGALALVLATPLSIWVLYELLDLGSHAWRQFVALHLGLLPPLALPLALTVSVLHYRLWDAGRALNRALVYSALTAIVLLLYGLGVGLFSALVPRQVEWFAPLLAAAGVAVLLPPLYRRLDRLARRFGDGEGGQPVEAPRPGAPVSVWLRLAQLAWLALAAVMVVALLDLLRDLPALARATEGEWLVQQSMGALVPPARTAAPAILVGLRLALAVVYVAAAALVFWRRRDEGMALYVATLLLLAPISLLPGDQEGWLSSLAMLVIAGQLLLLFIFPDGRLVPRSLRRRAALLGGLLATILLAYPLARQAAGAEGASYLTFLAAILAFTAAGVGSQVYRYRRLAGPAQRRQTRWVLFGLALQPIWIAWGLLWVGGAVAAVGVPDAVAALITLLLVLFLPAALPVTIALAVLRYRLWDVDRVINRAIVFSGLTLLVLLLYGLLVGLFSFLFQTGEGLLLSVLVTGLVAVLFNPLRQRLQQGVNRLMYGDRDDPVTVLAELGRRLEETAAPADILPAIAETVAQALKLPYAAIAVREGEELVVAAAHPPQETAPPAPNGLRAFPLVHGAREVGRLLARQRAADEPFTAEEERLLRNIARQAGAAVHAARLTTALQRSRQELVSAREEERRRIRRDLHDGLGPQLAGLSLKVNAARNLLPADAAAADHHLAGLEAQIQGAIGDIRRLVYALRPPALDQLGLAAALRAEAAHYAAEGLPVIVDAPEALPDLPAAVEVAAYRIAQEALNNVAQHAGARQVWLRLALESGTLQLEVRDDGRGLPAPLREGVGLASMRERAAELGGYCLIGPGEQGGTAVRAALPLPEG